jgi:trimeric autotransporter adhesin
MRVSSACSRFLVACGAVLLASTGLIGVGSSTASADAVTQFDLLNPAAGQPGSQFGQFVTVLPSGNIVVTDPSYDAGAVPDVGAVYLFGGTTRALISTLTGTKAGDNVGSGGVVGLSNGNYVVNSPLWDSGLAKEAGAVTWGSGTIGTSAAVGAANSLVGVTSYDKVGSDGVVVLPNGNYLIDSPNWDNGSAVDAGAVTWGNGLTGTTGAVGAANSLVGSTTDDKIGRYPSTKVLANGNYVVTAAFWDNGSAVDAGAVTWGNGMTGIAGAVGVTRSLVGTNFNDSVGGDFVLALSNSNYVVISPIWDNGGVVDVGAVTWGNGATGTRGPVGVGNSLIGTTVNDDVGLHYGVMGLSNGNYVVRSPSWDNGAAVDAGAVTWGNGATGTTGVVGVANSLVGATSYDYVGAPTVVVLSNGNYVVPSPDWDNGPVVDAGAVTWGDGTSGTTGAVGVAKSLVGTSPGDKVGSFEVVGLSNGNYVVQTSYWDNGSLVDAGAVTWGNGATGTRGVVSVANSLVGTTSGDYLGNFGVDGLSNGNYVVNSPFWDNGSVLNVGAVTWGNGASGTTGAVNVANSLVGTTPNDRVGDYFQGVVVLPNGNYVVSSPSWDNGLALDAGAITWGNGTSGTTGPVSAARSLIGTLSNGLIGNGSVVVLPNGNYLVDNPLWDNGSVLDVGAVTWGNGATGIAGVVGVANSLVGTAAFDKVGSDGVVVLSNGNYVVTSTFWDNGSVLDVGAVTWGNGATGIAGVVGVANSLVGTTSYDTVGSNDFGQLIVANSDGSYIVLSVHWDNGAVVDAGAATYSPATGITGAITPTNSAIGVSPGSLRVVVGRTTAGAYVISTSQDRVLLLFPGTVPPASTPTAEFEPLSPGRLADTRPSGVTVDSLFAGGGARAAGSTLELAVGGRGGVPATSQAVSLNITAADASADGFATVFPCGSPRPNASNLNYRAGRTQANAVITKLGTGGKVCVYVSSATQLIVDVNGSFPATSLLVSANPARVLDTRPSGETVDNLQTAGGLRAAGSITTLPIAGRANVPANAKAVIVNVTATGPTADGFLTVYPCGTPVPNASNLNYKSGASIANLVISKLGASGELCIKTSSATHLIVDVTGYFPAGSSYEALQPARLLDTRAGGTTIDNQFSAAGLRPSGTVTELAVTGRGGVSANAETVVLNITATGPTADGFVSVYPCGIAQPNASNLNFATGSDVANTVIVKPGTGGKVCIYNSGQTHLIADVNGYVPN